ncbi:unnamed protein product [Protopolystoma xenopodis]|uniref:Uncharacterized protein n=1 Tax=Protopolystoma xenopodis TaxID=117903 RepID=A0A448XLC2_9PLAT|nr:unnamed protein product [Protopolystoma xenopodis]
MVSRILRFLVFSPICSQPFGLFPVDFVPRSCNVFRYFGSFHIHVAADFSSCFTNILVLTVAAFDAMNYRTIKFVSLLVLRRQTGEKCFLLLCYHLDISLP